MKVQLLTSWVNSYSEHQSKRAESLWALHKSDKQSIDLFPAQSGLQGKVEQGAWVRGEGVHEQRLIRFISISEGIGADLIPRFGHVLSLECDTPGTAFGLSSSKQWW